MIFVRVLFVSSRISNLYHEDTDFVRERFLVNVKVGDKAPDFTLFDVNMAPCNLYDFLGKKVVITFFVGAFTSTCTKEACEFRDSMARLTNLNAQVIGISVNDPFTNKSFAEKNMLPYPVLSDYNREVIRRYGIEQENFAGMRGYTVARRSIIIVDEEGVICYIWFSDNTDEEPNYEEIQRVLTGSNVKV